MKVLNNKKTPEEIAKELNDETPEVGGDFADKLAAKLKKYGYEPSDLSVRRAVVSAFFELRR